MVSKLFCPHHSNRIGGRGALTCDHCPSGDFESPYFGAPVTPDPSRGRERGKHVEGGWGQVWKINLSYGDGYYAVELPSQERRIGRLCCFLTTLVGGSRWGRRFEIRLEPFWRTPLVSQPEARPRSSMSTH